VKTGDPDERDDEQEADERVSSGVGDKRILGSVVLETQTEQCRRRL